MKKAEKEPEYVCSISTVYGVDHKPNCEGSCGYPKDNAELYGRHSRRSDRKRKRNKLIDKGLSEEEIEAKEGIKGWDI